MFCPNCGKEIENVKFCPECGAQTTDTKSIAEIKEDVPDENFVNYTVYRNHSDMFSSFPAMLYIDNVYMENVCDGDATTIKIPKGKYTLTVTFRGNAVSRAINTENENSCRIGVGSNQKPFFVGGNIQRVCPKCGGEMKSTVVPEEKKNGCLSAFVCFVLVVAAFGQMLISAIMVILLVGTLYAVLEKKNKTTSYFVCQQCGYSEKIK